MAPKVGIFDTLSPPLGRRSAPHHPRLSRQRAGQYLHTSIAGISPRTAPLPSSLAHRRGGHPIPCDPPSISMARDTRDPLWWREPEMAQTAHYAQGTGSGATGDQERPAARGAQSLARRSRVARSTAGHRVRRKASHHPHGAGCPRRQGMVGTVAQREHDGGRKRTPGGRFHRNVQ